MSYMQRKCKMDNIGTMLKRSGLPHLSRLFSMFVRLNMFNIKYFNKYDQTQLKQIRIICQLSKQYLKKKIHLVQSGFLVNIFV